ncbi:MAG: hypothetical protein GY820_15675 [Gammaproteobacteria bacterium]|nr:hypothetical protein [Gammaproteobacteria bacterium]
MRVALIALLLLALGVGWAFEARLGRIQQQVQLLVNKEKPMTFTWQTAGAHDSKVGVVLNVPQDPGETIEAWRVRARNELTAMQAEFPPIEQ